MKKRKKTCINGIEGLNSLFTDYTISICKKSYCLSFFIGLTLLNSNLSAQVYTIPVVFHVIHLGEQEGVGSNIPDAQIYQALADLNAAFNDQTHPDIDIEFCLAQRNPNNMPSEGIERVSGSGISSYSQNGVTLLNESNVRAASFWLGGNYLNISIVHNILAGVPALSNEYGISSYYDGIVVDKDAIGGTTMSKVLVHEVGHFLFLKDTYEGGDVTNCPMNIVCDQDGDMICDTPPHKPFNGSCNALGLNSCDNNNPNAPVVYNYMSDSDETCRNRFTSGQKNKMRSSLLELRKRLTYSLGCEPGCSTTVADFTASHPNTIEVGATVSFTNASMNANNYSWHLFGDEFSTNLNTELTFSKVGRFEVCLDATGPGNCVNRSCETFLVLPQCSDPNGPQGNPVKM